MPAVPSGKVLVTGANGYIAVWLVKQLLEDGYSVRGTVRSASREGHLKNLFKDFGDKFETLVVPDITKDGAFDEAVKGVDAIEHLASPFHFNAEDPQELIRPAVAGTKSILESALKHGKHVKRIVVTSSVAAILRVLPEPHVFTEEEWNTTSQKEIEEKGRDALPLHKYRASKTMAERAAWDFVKEHKGEIGFDLVVINPPFVFGPVLQEVDKPENLNTSMGDYYTTVIQGKRDLKSLTSISNSWVDVRDTALAHKLALQKEEAGGQRILIAAGVWNWQDWINVAHKQDSSLTAGDVSHDPSKSVYMLRFDVSKAKKLFGIDYIDKEQTTKDILAQFREKGWY